MGKADTTTESMGRIASVVNEISANISIESEKLIKEISSICEKTEEEIERSERQISDWESEIDDLEAKISSLEDMEDEDHDYSSEIAECQAQISELRAKIRHERIRNNQLRQTLLQFRQYSSLALQKIKQLNIACNNANAPGKHYIRKKTGIISGYGKNVCGGGSSGISQSGSFVQSNEGITNSSTDHSGCTDTSTQGESAILSFGTDINSANKWGKESFSSWNSSLTFFEQQALVDYKKELNPHEASYYVNINNTLRGKDTFRDGNQIRCDRIHEALSRASTPSDVVAYRSISMQAYNEMCERARLSGSDGLQDNAFMSCSLVSDNLFTRNSEVVMRLTIPEGSHGAFIGNMDTNYASECEILLDCGSTIFVTDTSEAPRSTITGNPADIDTITIVEGVVET